MADLGVGSAHAPRYTQHGLQILVSVCSGLVQVSHMVELTSVAA